MPTHIWHTPISKERLDEVVRDVLDTYREKLLAFVCRKLNGNVEDSEDLVQTVFFQFSNRLVKPNLELNDRQEVWFYLLKIARCRICDQYRSLKSKGSLEDLGFSQYEVVARRDYETQISEWLDDILTHLADSQLQEIVRHRLAGMSDDEIAKENGISKRTLNRRLKVIRDKARDTPLLDRAS